SDSVGAQPGVPGNPSMPGSPGMPGNPVPNPFSSLLTQRMVGAGALGIILNLMGAVWTAILLVIGLSSIQRISPGAAFGTVVLSFLVMVVLCVGLVLVLGIAIAAAFGTMGASAVH